MKQPELGKKIAELRKAKGLTQEELVEKCNINVRTLQRIETGEATPRSYTIKIIFAALDCNIYDSTKSITSRFVRIERTALKWLEQLYKYAFDLFNLKTNTIKKITILSVPLIAICAFLLFSYNSNVKAQSRQAIITNFEKASSSSKFIRLFNSGQIDSLSMLYLDNACLMPDFPSSIAGRENINDYFRQLFNQGFRFTNIKSTFKVVNDSIAVERGIWAVNVNSTPISIGTSLTQWRYLNGQWWIENSMSKTDKVINQEAYK
jgi:transcriptional regulator with XRE-family HTH domain/ketosteroid isomerase-like protein